MAAPDEFLNPKSMATPGVAGMVTTMIATTLANTLGWPLHPTALVFSFLFASGGLVTAGVHVWIRILLFVFNGFIVYAVAMSAGTAASIAVRPPATGPARAETVVAGATDTIEVATRLVESATGEALDPARIEQLREDLAASPDGVAEVETATGARFQLQLGAAKLVAGGDTPTTGAPDTSRVLRVALVQRPGGYFRKWSEAGLPANQ